MTKNEFELASRRAKLNLHCFCYCRRAVDNTIITYIVCCGNFRPFQVNIVVLLPHHTQRNHLGCAVRLCQFVAIGRMRSVAVICFVSNHNDDKI